MHNPPDRTNFISESKSNLPAVSIAYVTIFLNGIV